MSSITQLEDRRKAVLDQMESIRSLCTASLSEQMLRVKHKGKEEPVLRGPYFVLSRWENGKTRSRRVRGVRLEQIKQDVANHKRFVALCAHYAELTEQLGALEREAAASKEAVKKGLKPQSSKTRKSSG